MFGFIPDRKAGQGGVLVKEEGRLGISLTLYRVEKISAEVEKEFHNHVSGWKPWAPLAWLDCNPGIGKLEEEGARFCTRPSDEVAWGSLMG